jgi:hypothetical protein
VKDVERIKQLINVEKKRVPCHALDDYAVAQTGSQPAGSGCYFDPHIFHTTQGMTNATRNGASIKPQSFHLDLRVKRVNGFSAQKLKYEIFWIPDQDKMTGLSGSNVTKYYLPSTFDGTYDTNSSRNFEEMSGFRTIRKGTVYLAANTNADNQLQMKTVGIGGKLKHHIKYDVGTDNVRHGSIGIVLTANRGHTTGTGDNSPLLVSLQGTLYYTDN